MTVLPDAYGSHHIKSYVKTGIKSKGGNKNEWLDTEKEAKSAMDACAKKSPKNAQKLKENLKKWGFLLSAQEKNVRDAKFANFVLKLSKANTGTAIEDVLRGLYSAKLAPKQLKILFNKSLEKALQLKQLTDSDKRIILETFMDSVYHPVGGRINLSPKDLLPAYDNALTLAHGINKPWDKAIMLARLARQISSFGIMAKSKTKQIYQAVKQVANGLNEPQKSNLLRNLK
jgi:hypothetical protein